MNSREKILNAVKANQPQRRLDVILEIKPVHDFNAVDKFKEFVVNAGGAVLELNNVHDIAEKVHSLFPETPPLLIKFIGMDTVEPLSVANSPREFHGVEVSVMTAHFGVAENGAVWLTQNDMGNHRVLPFISQHLIVVLNRNEIVFTMHDAYQRLANETYDFGCFISGPSKTADIEQSLVLGAHGARSMHIFLT
jgi:L-lactate dehydrogenase complex protein LldG